MMRTDMGLFGFDGAPMHGLAGKGQPRGGPNIASVNDPEREGGQASTRCRHCGTPAEDVTTSSLQERDHLQVVVACGACGHVFAAMSRN